MSYPLPAGMRLATPPIHPATPHAARVAIFEAVLRREWGLACTLADIEYELATGRHRDRQDVAIPSTSVASAIREAASRRTGTSRGNAGTSGVAA